MLKKVKFNINFKRVKEKRLTWQSDGSYSVYTSQEIVRYIETNFSNAKIYGTLDLDESIRSYFIEIKFKTEADEAFFILKSSNQIVVEVDIHI